MRIPLADAALDKMGHFLANGGAVWFEMVRLTGEFGLIEGSTPECRGPRQLLTYQRAQDRLFAASAADAKPRPFALLKNCRDSVGNYYGAQENYEFPIASGVRLAIWRVGLVLLAPLIPLTWIGLLARVLLYIVILLIYIVVSHLAFLLLLPFMRDRIPLRRWLFDGLLTAQGTPIENGIESALNMLALLVCFPLASSMYLLLRFTAFVGVRKQLTAFLVSRSIFAGAGTLDDNGEFHVAEKAHGLNCLTGLGGFIDDRPVYTFGHFLKAALSEAWNLHRRYVRLFRRRQRLQIALGDSNMAQTAEFLRIGTTMLVLDMLEDGALADAPRLRRPLAALKTFAADPGLREHVEMLDGTRRTALEIQQWYLDAAKAWLARRPWHEEASEIVELWEQTLEMLAGNQEPLVGRIDWITKRFLMEQAGNDASFAVKKKIDLKYHQLGPDGYYAQLEACGATPVLVPAEEIDRAARTPPPGSPASARGRFIREFAGEGLAVNWDFVLLRRRFRTQIIDLDHYFHQQPPQEEAASK